MVVMDGCSGSSYIVTQVKYLFNLHGHPTSFNHEPELFVPRQNPFFHGNRSLGEAVEMVNKDEVSRNKTLVFKGSSENLHIEDGRMAWSTQVAPSLRKMQTYAVYAWRSNVLDHAVCMVKDCFSLAYGTKNFSKEALGHPVAANGTRRQECFQRRKANVSSKDYKVTFHPEVLTEYLRTSYDNVLAEREKLTRTVGPFGVVTAEELTAFEHDRSQFDRSCRAWHSLLRSLGIRPDKAIIRSYLAKTAGSRPAPALHSETIFNFEEVKAALVKAGNDIAGLMRM